MVTSEHICFYIYLLFILLSYFLVPCDRLSRLLLAYEHVIIDFIYIKLVIGYRGQ